MQPTFFLVQYLNPSAIDISNTKKVKEGAELLTIELFDHIIVGADTNYCSLREQGNI